VRNVAIAWKGTEVSFETAFEKKLMFCGIEFQTVRAANRKTFRPMGLAVKETCRRLSEEKQRGLEGLLKLISDKR